MSQPRQRKEPSTPVARPLEVLMALPPDAYLNPEEVRIYARLLSRQAVYNWLNDEHDPLPATKAGGWRIRRGDLDAYLRKKHNRRETDQPTHGTSDETLRRQLGLLIEVSKAALEWKRAGAMLRAAGESFDLEFLEQRAEELRQKGAQLETLVAAVSERTLTSLRFMLPSIHSDLTLPQEPAGAEAATTVAEPAAQVRTVK